MALNIEQLKQTVQTLTGTNATVAAGMLLPPAETFKPEDADFVI